MTLKDFGIVLKSFDVTPKWFGAILKVSEWLRRDLGIILEPSEWLRGLRSDAEVLGNGFEEPGSHSEIPRITLKYFGAALSGSEWL
jgi:hypothetical protein